MYLFAVSKEKPLFLVRKLIFPILFLLTVLIPDQAWSGTQTEWVEFDHAKIRMLSRSRSIAPTQNEMWVALDIKLNKDWKTYWRTPGKVGQSLSIDTEGSENIDSYEINWPAPIRFESFEIESNGYKGNVVIPIKLKLKKPGQPVKLKFYVDFFVCGKTCIPYDGELSLTIKKGVGQSSVYTQLIDVAIAKTPKKKSKTDHFEILSTALDTTKKKLYVEFKIIGQKENPNLIIPETIENVFVEGGEDLFFEKPSFQYLSQNKLRVTFDVEMDEEDPELLIGRDVTVTAIGRGDAIETKRTLIPPAPMQTQNFFIIMGLAVIGGFILNFMPCVLPVLSIKLISVIEHIGQEKRKTRIGFLVSSLGILFSFWLLASITVSLKLFGSTVGWGTQYQEPVFLIIMIIILIIFACNLWGLFEIILPHKMNNGLNSLFAPHKESMSSHFVSGALATLLATPCSAPFLGTAVGFALSQGIFEIYIIFTMLGIGLAIPYILVAIVPNIASLLPRPGSWMLALRRVLGVFLFITALWFLSVLVAEIGLIPTLILSSSFFIGILFLWYVRIATKGSENYYGTLSVVSGFFILFLIYSITFQKPEVQRVEGIWIPFNDKQVEKLVNQGELVFVNVTADWCITCKVNERLVLSQSTLIERFKKENVIAIRADWTNQDEKIAEYLARFDRFGIPFNIVYGPAAPQGLILPELLSATDVLEALSKASGERLQWSDEDLI